MAKSFGVAFAPLCRRAFGIDVDEPIVGWLGRRRVLVSPDLRLAGKTGTGGLGMLLESVEPVEAVHRHEPGQHESPKSGGADCLRCVGTPGH